MFVSVIKSWLLFAEVSIIGILLFGFFHRFKMVAGHITSLSQSLKRCIFLTIALFVTWNPNQLSFDNYDKRHTLVT